MVQVIAPPRQDDPQADPRARHAGRPPLILAPWIALGIMLTLWPRQAGPSRLVERPHRAVPPANWTEALWRAWQAFNRDNILSVAGAVSFFTVLALFPALAAFVSLFGMVGDVDAMELQLSSLGGVLPDDAIDFIGGEIIRIASQTHDSLSLTFVGGLALSIWSANAGIKALMTGLNAVYEARERRGFFRLNLVSLAFTASGLLVCVATLSWLLAAPGVLSLAHLDPASPLWGVLRWPILLSLATTGLSLLYRHGPCGRGPRTGWIDLGALAGAVAWLAISLLFSWYVGHIAHFSVTYGSLSAMVGFMIWTWLSVIAVLAGAEFDAQLERKTPPSGP